MDFGIGTRLLIGLVCVGWFLVSFGLLIWLACRTEEQIDRMKEKTFRYIFFVGFPIFGPVVLVSLLFPNKENKDQISHINDDLKSIDFYRGQLSILKEQVEQLKNEET